MKILYLRATEAEFKFHAGQYLEILHPDGEAIPLSIASTAADLPSIRLHFRGMPGAPGAAALEALLGSDGQKTTTLQIRGPAGAIKVEATEPRRILLVAGGTGMAQALSIAETLQSGRSGAHWLLACADHDADFYCQDAFETLTCLHSCFLADARRIPDNQGLLWLKEHALDLMPARIILCGSPGFVYAVTDTLMSLGVDQSQMESDVFTYSPR